MSSQNHIRSKVDKLLIGIETDLITQAGFVEIAISHIDRCLSGSEHDTVSVESADMENADLNKKIFQKSVDFISKESPMADDLRSVISAMKVSDSYERLGKITKNIVNRLSLIDRLQEQNVPYHSMRELFREAHVLLNGAKGAYFSSDVALAKSVIEKDYYIDQAYQSMFREYLTYMLEDPKHLSKFVHLQFVAKQIERMGDHSTTIAEQAIFKSNGIDLSSLSRSKVDYLDE